MADLVDPQSIEQIVGIERHPALHYGRAVISEHTVYVLHSAECRDSGRDLRQCPYSLALDRGIDHPSASWWLVADQPVPVKIHHGFLVPDLEAVKAALAEQAHRDRG